VQELNMSDCKSYLVACKSTKHACIIDPVLDKVPLYLSVLAYQGLKLTHALETHTHADHESGAVDLATFTDCLIGMHEQSPSPLVSLRIKDKSIVQVGNVPIQVFATPGHTPDSSSFYISPEFYRDEEFEGILFSGDALLVNGTGRTDFAGGDAGVSYDSVKKLFKLDGRTLVLPGHDYKGQTHTSIGNEVKNNPRVAQKTKEEYIKLMKELFDSRNLPDRIQQVLQVNQAGLKPHIRHKLNYPKLQELGTIRQIKPKELVAKLLHDNTDSAPLLIDLRSESEIASDGLGHIEGSIVVPLEHLSEFAKEEAAKDPWREVVCVCRVGIRSNSAAAMLSSAGFKRVANLKGGMMAWKEEMSN
jgi:sulfur dioxygenase